MRKLFIILLVLLTIISTACSASLAEKPSIEDGYSCEVDISYGDAQYGANLKRIGQGVWEAELTEPSTVKGMSMHYENGEVVVRYKGFNVSLPSASVPMKAVVARVFDVLDNIAANPDSIAKKSGSGNIVIEGKIAKNAYIITFGGDGKLMSVNIPSEQLSVTVKTPNDNSTENIENQ